MNPELHRALNSLCSGLTTTLDRKSLKELLMETEGRAFVQGYMCDIRSKSLGAGAYRVWAERQN